MNMYVCMYLYVYLYVCTHFIYVSTCNYIFMYKYIYICIFNLLLGIHTKHQRGIFDFKKKLFT